MHRALFSITRETQPFTSPRTNIVELAGVLSDCDSILDIGCGGNSPLRMVPCSQLVGVDAYQPDLDMAKTAQTHNEFVLSDAQNIEQHFHTNQFDACVAIDVIEHLTKKDGLKLLNILETIAKRKVVIFTPNGFLPQSSEIGGDYQKHLSGWIPEEMTDMGYRVIGLDGIKSLRTEHHRLRFRPFPLWAIVSWLTQKLWCKNHAKSAAAILCVKKMR